MANPLPNPQDVETAPKEYEAKKTDVVKTEGNSSRNQEIAEALKEFETKSNSEQRVLQAKIHTPSDETPKMVQILIKSSGGAVKNRKQAEWILLGFVIMVLGISTYLFFGGNKSIKEPSGSLKSIIQNMPVNNQH